jgi:hypothetical protein
MCLLCNGARGRGHAGDLSSCGRIAVWLAAVSLLLVFEVSCVRSIHGCRWLVAVSARHRPLSDVSHHAMPVAAGSYYFQRTRLWRCGCLSVAMLSECGWWARRALLLQPALQRQLRLHPAAPACPHLPAPAQRHQCMRHCPAATPTLQASITQLPQPALQGQLWLHLPATARNCAAPLMQAALPHYH